MINRMKNDSINDFGKQFKYHNKIDDYWGSQEILEDIVNPFDLSLVKNKIICEMGVGSGRILKNLTKLAPKKIYAIEPSDAIDVAKKNNQNSNVEILFQKISGQMINFNNEIDYFFSIGVIHHIPEAEIVCKKIYESLKPKGKFIVWLYGKEGNELYLLIFNNLRKFTKLMPDRLLNLFSIFLNLAIKENGNWKAIYIIPLFLFFGCSLVVFVRVFVDLFSKISKSTLISKRLRSQKNIT